MTDAAPYANGPQFSGDRAGSHLTRFARRRPVWSLVIFFSVILFLWLIFAVWPDGLTDAIGRKRSF